MELFGRVASGIICALAGLRVARQLRAIRLPWFWVQVDRYEVEKSPVWN
jgi:hypothetical protein